MENKELVTCSYRLSVQVWGSLLASTASLSWKKQTQNRNLSSAPVEPDRRGRLARGGQLQVTGSSFRDISICIQLSLILKLLRVLLACRFSSLWCSLLWHSAGGVRVRSGAVKSGMIDEASIKPLLLWISHCGGCAGRLSTNKYSGMVIKITTQVLWQQPVERAQTQSVFFPLSFSLIIDQARLAARNNSRDSFIQKGRLTHSHTLTRGVVSWETLDVMTGLPSTHTHT